MKYALIAAILGLSACVAGLPQGSCSQGYVLHTSPAGTERCIKPGMRVGDGVIESALIAGAAVAL